METTASELIAAFPELKRLHFAESQDELLDLKEKVGRQVEVLFDGFPNTCSVEQVKLEALNSQHVVVSTTKREFQYLMIAHAEWVVDAKSQADAKTPPAGKEAALFPEEYRTDSHGNKVDIQEQPGLHGRLVPGGRARNTSRY